MKAYTALYDDVMPELPGAERALVLHHIKMTCREFYEISLLARDTLPAIDVLTGVPLYDVGSPVGPLDTVNFATCAITSVKYDGRPIDSVSKPILDREDIKWMTATGVPYRWTQESESILRLVKVPDSDLIGGLIVEVARRPLYDGIGIDDDIFDQYRRDIGAGVKARLMRMPRKPWSDKQSAGEYQGDFQLAIGAAGTQVAKSFSGPMRTRSYG